MTAAMPASMLAMIKGAKNKYSRSTSKVVKLKEGKTRIRVVPKQVEGQQEGQFWADVGVHWIKPEKNAKPIAVVGCDDIAHGKPCDCCKAIEQSIQSAVDDESIAIYKDWKAKKAIWINAVIRSGADAGEDPQVLELTPTTFSSILSMAEEYAEDYGYIFDGKTGIEFTIERKGKGLDTEYTVLPQMAGNKPLTKDQIDKATELSAMIEREHFRGEEKKALNAIASISGVTLGISGPKRAGLLTGATASVVDAELEAAVDVAATEGVEETVTETVEDVPFEDSKPVAAAKPAPAKPAAAKPAAAKPAAKPAAPAADEFGADLSTDDIEGILGELDNIK